MDIKEMEELMLEHGVVLRAIPRKSRVVLGKIHIDKYPQGTIQYLEEYKREMLVFYEVPKNAGKFIFECVGHTDSMVRFYAAKFYDGIEEAFEDLKNGNYSKWPKRR